MIDQNTVTEEKSQNPYLGMSKSQLAEKERDIRAQISAMRQKQVGDFAGNAIRNVSNVFLQRGGLKPIEDPNADINKLIQAAQIKSMYANKKPIIKNLGGSLVQVDPDSGEATTIMESSAKTWKPTTREEAIAFEKDKAAIKGDDPARILKNEIDRDKLEERRRKVAEAKDRQQLSIDTIKTAAQGRINTIDRIDKGLKYFGRFGKLSSQIAPSSILGGKGYDERKTWENAINTLQAQLGFDMMTELKNASRTGATGLGQLSEKEGEWLKQASTELSRDISPDRAREILQEMKRLHEKVIQGGPREAPTELTPPQSMGVGSPIPTSAGQAITFNSEQEAVAANLPKGTPVIINGRRAIWE